MSNETLSLKSKKEATGGATVTVGSKLPMDLTLQLYDFKTKHGIVLEGDWCQPCHDGHHRRVRGSDRGLNTANCF